MRLALDVLDGVAEVLQVEGDTDVVDAALEVKGEPVRSVQAKTRAEPYVWGPAEIADVITEWLAGPVAEAEHFDFVTDGSLGPEVMNKLRPTLARIADGTASDEDRKYLTGKGLDPTAHGLKRVGLHSRLPDGRALLEDSTLRLLELRERENPISVEEARDVVWRLFGEVVLGAGEEERQRRRLDREMIGKVVGVPLDVVDAAEAWGPSASDAYREAVLHKAPDPAWTLLDLLTKERPPALTFVRPTESMTPPKAATTLLTETESVLIEGPAGAGKTTTLTQLAQAAAESDRVPVLLDLASYTAGSITHLVHAELERGSGRSLAPGAVDLLMDRPSTLLLIDGVGELVPEQRRSLISDLELLVGARKDARLMLVARSGRPLKRLGLVEYELQGLDDERRRKIASSLLLSDEELVQKLESDLGSAADNPLLFTMAVGLRSRGIETGGRASLFRHFVEGLQEREEGDSLSPASLAGIEYSAFQLRLDGRYSAERWWWLEQITAARGHLIEQGVFGEGTTSAEASMDELISVGLLRRLGYGPEYGLLHDLFCDWFAGEAIRKGLGALADDVPEELEEALVFLGEQGELAPEQLDSVARSPIAAAAVADVLPASALKIDAITRHWQSLKATLAEPVRVGYDKLTPSVSRDGRTLSLLAPGDSPRLSCLVGEGATSLSAAVDLWLAAVRLALNEEIRERSTLAKTDAAALAVQISEQSALRQLAIKSEIKRVVPSLEARIMAARGSGGLRGWLLPARTVPGIPGSDQEIREHLLRYVILDEDHEVTAVNSEEEIPADQELLTTMVAESYLRDSPRSSARDELRKVLANLIPRFDGR